MGGVQVLGGDSAGGGEGPEQEVFMVLPLLGAAEPAKFTDAQDSINTRGECVRLRVRVWASVPRPSFTSQDVLA